jgi:hypothetical protein
MGCADLAVEAAIRSGVLVRERLLETGMVQAVAVDHSTAASSRVTPLCRAILSLLFLSFTRLLVDESLSRKISL